MASNVDQSPIRPKRRSPFGMGGWFDDFFEDMGGLDSMVEDMMREMEENLEKNRGRIQSGKPFVYGVNIKVGPDGKPHVEQFGNFPANGHLGAPTAASTAATQKQLNAKAPNMDVIEEQKVVRVIVELPGVEKKFIHPHVTTDTLTLTVDDPQRTYHAVRKLPVAVKANTAKALVNNGILELTVEREKPAKKAPGAEVKIE